MHIRQNVWTVYLRDYSSRAYNIDGVRFVIMIVSVSNALNRRETANGNRFLDRYDHIIEFLAEHGADPRSPTESSKFLGLIGWLEGERSDSCLFPRDFCEHDCDKSEM